MSFKLLYIYIFKLVFTETNIFRKLLHIAVNILIWYLLVQSSDKSEWYIELYTKNNTTVKVPRDEYQEYKELWNVNNYSENQTKNYYKTLYNESQYWTNYAGSYKEKYRYDKKTIKSFTQLFAIHIKHQSNR